MSLNTWRCQGPHKPSSCTTFTLNSYWSRAATSKKRKKIKVLCLCTQCHFSCVSTFCDPVDCSLPGFSVREGFSRQEYWNALANTSGPTLLELYISFCPSRQLPEYLVLPESLQLKQLHHLHTWPSQGQTQVLQGSLRSKPQWMTQCRDINKTTVETQGQCG